MFQKQINTGESDQRQAQRGHGNAALAIFGAPRKLIIKSALEKQ